MVRTDGGAPVGVALVIHGPSKLRLSATLATGQVAPGVDTAESHSFAWGSVTKTFTGAAVLRLVADGRLGLDEELEALRRDQDCALGVRLGAGAHAD